MLTFIHTAYSPLPPACSFRREVCTSGGLFVDGSYPLGRPNGPGLPGAQISFPVRQVCRRRRRRAFLSDAQRRDGCAAECLYSGMVGGTSGEAAAGRERRGVPRRHRGYLWGGHTTDGRSEASCLLFGRRVGFGCEMKNLRQRQTPDSIT